MIKESEIKKLFSHVSSLIANQKKLEKAKGETFNTFSILKLETNENRVHSAFIAELLNPKGSHLQGNTFLKLFLMQLRQSDYLDCDSTNTITELPIGKVDVLTKTGGRIDILLKDNKGNHLSIENKILATDGENQIERYCNYKKKSNIVYYLTLFGEAPSINSRGKLVAGEHFHIISYKDDILQWLEACLKMAKASMLKESIKQYLILVHKITDTMDNQHEKKLLELISQKLKEASFIASNFNEVKVNIAEDVRKDVFKKIENKLSDKLQASINADIRIRWAQIIINYSRQSNVLSFHLQGFNPISPNADGLFIGIYNPQKKMNSFAKSISSKPQRWLQKEYIQVDGKRLSFSDPEFLSQLYSDTNYRRKAINEIIRHTIDYITKYEDQLHQRRKFLKPNF